LLLFGFYYAPGLYTTVVYIMNDDQQPSTWATTLLQHITTMEQQIQNSPLVCCIPPTILHRHNSKESTVHLWVIHGLYLITQSD
jgi:hypothetical protein